MKRSWLRFFLCIHLSMTCTVPTLDDLTVQTNFSLHQFLGVWYKIKWYKTDVYQELDVAYDYYQSFEFENSSTERLLVSGKGRLSYEEECFSFGPWLIIANNSGKLLFEKFNITNSTNLNWPYWILKTDYHHYALIYSCQSLNISFNETCRHPMITVFSRTVLLSNDYLIHLDDYIDDILCLNLTQFQVVLHSDKSCYTMVSNGIEFMKKQLNLWFILPSFYFFLIYK